MIMFILKTMTVITTKYDIGSKVWTLNNGAPYKFEIESISIIMLEKTMIIKYGDDTLDFIRRESECYPTKQALGAAIAKGEYGKN